MIATSEYTGENTVQRHCGLDPQSPENLQEIPAFAGMTRLGEWNDGVDWTSAPLSPRNVSGSERSRTAGLLRCSCLTARNDVKRKIIIQNHINYINQSSDK